MKLHVEVTAEDIAAGKRENSDACPIALAIHRLPGVIEVCVEETIAVATDEGQFDIGTPASASAFISAFDAGDPVQPFAFDLEFEPTADDDECHDCLDDDCEGAP